MSNEVTPEAGIAESSEPRPASADQPVEAGTHNSKNSSKNSGKEPSQGGLPRRCARVNCQDEAAYTLTADYDERLMAVGPLSPERTPPALDLCERHHERLVPPTGWQLLRHQPRTLEGLA